MLKYIASLALIVALIALTSIVTYYSVENIIINNVVEKSSVNIASSFKNTLWEKYSFMFEMYENDLARMESSSQFIFFQHEAELFFNDINLLQVEIFHKGDQKVFSLRKYFAHEHRPSDYKNQLKNYSLLRDKNKNLLVIVKLDEKEPTPSTIEITYRSADIIHPIRNLWITFTAILTILACTIFFWMLYKIREGSSVLNEQFEINMKLKKAKESIEEISTQKSQFLANVSHELKTPLNAIIGFSDLIRTSDKAAEDHKEYANDIYYSGNHLLNLINDILDFSKSELNKIKIKNNLFDLTRLVETCVRMTTTRNKSIKITRDFFSDKILIKSDHKRVKQVILNILSNSVKFTKEDGEIKISIKKLKSEISIEISDNGIGIPEKDIAIALSVFGQSNSELSRKYDGTGIGLPLSKKLVEIIGGTFEIESEENKGTMVKIRLPYSDDILSL